MMKMRKIDLFSELNSRKVQHFSGGKKNQNLKYFGQQKCFELEMLLLCLMGAAVQMPHVSFFPKDGDSRSDCISHDSSVAFYRRELHREIFWSRCVMRDVVWGGADLGTQRRMRKATVAAYPNQNI